MSEVAAPVIVDTISFIEQSEVAGDDYGYDTSAGSTLTEEVEIIEVVEVVAAESSDSEPDDKTKPIEIVKDEDLF